MVSSPGRTVYQVKVRAVRWAVLALYPPGVRLMDVDPAFLEAVLIVIMVQVAELRFRVHKLESQIGQSSN